MPYPTRARLQLSSLLALAFLLSTVAAAAPLRSALEIRSLSQEAAAQSLPVELEGTILGLAEPYGISFILIDAQGDSIYTVGTEDQISPLRPGHQIRLSGHTDPGGYAPFVRIHEVEILGQGQIPTPLPVTLSDLSAGGLDSRWVETYGIVRSCRIVDHSGLPDGKASLIVLAYGNERISVQAQFTTNPEQLIDAEVRVRAICVNQHNRNRQFIRPALHEPKNGEITILSRPETDPFQSEPVPIHSLLEFFPEINYHHRVLVQGTVLHSIPGDSLWIRDGTRAIRVKTRQVPTPELNNQVQVAGFLYSDAYSPALEDAEFKTLDTSQATAPRELASYADAFDHDADLIRFTALLVDKRAQPEGLSIRLEWQNNDRSITSGNLLTTELAPSELPAVGSLVEITGICSVFPVETDNISGSLTPGRFEVLLRSAADLKVLQPPSFWNTETILLVLLVLLAIAVLTALGIYIAAQRRLNEQAHRREMAETEFSAILHERNRLAREIHDTLSQGLGAISVQLELARSQPDPSEKLEHHLSTAHQIVRASLGEARASIWKMRSQILEKSDLPDALAAILHQLTDQTGVTIEEKVVGERRRLSSATENNLLRIGQEAITNATKHAHASRITLTVTFQKGETIIEVCDDGIGFDAAKSAPTTQSFGLVGMKERADQIGARLSLESAPEKGTRLTVSYPG